MKRKSKLWIIMGLAALVSWACEENPLEPDLRGENEVWFQGNQVNPKTLTVSVGTEVTWTNKDDVTHAVDGGTFMNPTPDSKFHSDNLNQDQQFRYTFSNSGTFSYYCSIHPARQAETGTITVN